MIGFRLTVCRYIAGGLLAGEHSGASQCQQTETDPGPLVAALVLAVGVISHGCTVSPWATAGSGGQ